MFARRIKRVLWTTAYAMFQGTAPGYRWGLALQTGIGGALLGGEGTRSARR